MGNRQRDEVGVHPNGIEGRRKIELMALKRSYIFQWQWV
jgi:hypothetical protein